MKEHLQKLKGDKNMKERRRDPACGVSSPRSNITRAMWGRIPKEPNFYGLRNQLKIANPNSQSALVIHAPGSRILMFQHPGRAFWKWALQHPPLKHLEKQSWLSAIAILQNSGHSKSVSHL